MDRKRLLTAVLCLFLLQSYLNAQDKSKVPFGKVSPQDFTLPSTPIIDSNTNAVILYDRGSTHFVGNSKGWFSYVYKREKRVRIINKKAFGAATHEIGLYGEEDYIEKLDNLSASTYNLENGKVVETKLEKKEIFEERESKKWTIKKFTLPAVKEGSIIEYTYTITSPYLFRLPPWIFQSQDYPSLWSEYEVVIPQTLSYVFVRQGVHRFSVDKQSEGRELYRVKEKIDDGGYANISSDYQVSANTIKHTWAMKEVPAFHVENYISDPRNYLDNIEFQLAQTYDGDATRDVSNNWKKVTEELMAEENFGIPILGELDWLGPIMDKIGVDNVEPLDQAKMIYYYVTSNFTCTDHNSLYIKSRLEDVVKKRSGTVGDINLLLVAMLRKKGFTADPVALSTRENGFNLPNYPILEKLNYVIVKLTVAGKVYYLDAAHPQLGFGQLAGNCYNGYGRIISSADTGSVNFYADSLKEKKTTVVLIINNDKGGIEGSFQSTLGEQESYNTRLELGNTKEKEYFKNIQTAYGDDLDISNPGIDSLDQPGMPVKIHYDFRLKQASDASLVYFNPLFGEAYRKNPFTAADRKYPVEMPYTFDDVYIFNMEVPTGYVVEELPKSTKVAFNGNEGFFEYLAAADGNNIQLRTRVRLDRAFFSPEDYSSLRDFFAYIVKKESEQIVLKKK